MRKRSSLSERPTYLKTLVMKTGLVKIWNPCPVLELRQYIERERVSSVASDI
jgi:hypothetical protein